MASEVTAHSGDEQVGVPADDGSGGPVAAGRRFDIEVCDFDEVVGRTTWTVVAEGVQADRAEDALKAACTSDETWKPASYSSVEVPLARADTPVGLVRVIETDPAYRSWRSVYEFNVGVRRVVSIEPADRDES